MLQTWSVCDWPDFLRRLSSSSIHILDAAVLCLQCMGELAPATSQLCSYVLCSGCIVMSTGNALVCQAASSSWLCLLCGCCHGSSVISHHAVSFLPRQAEAPSALCCSAALFCGCFAIAACNGCSLLSMASSALVSSWHPIWASSLPVI